MEAERSIMDAAAETSFLTLLIRGQDRTLTRSGPHPTAKQPSGRQPMLSRPRRPRAAVAAAALCLLATTGCSDSKGSPESPTSAASVSPSLPKEARITIKDFTFKPADLAVRPGAKVTVVNEDSSPHTVTATGSKAFDTGDIAAGKTLTFTAPSKSGKYAYICTIHPSMKGSLTVR
ncbi:cupredoxin domain-containing protein [Streptomyces sp. NPDC054887]